MSSVWKTVNLDSVIDIERESVQPSGINSGTKYVGLEHMTSEGGFAGVVSVLSGEIASSKFRFDEGHVLYGKLRPYLRKTARPKFRGVCSTDILPLKPKAELDKGFLYHFLRLDQTVELATSLCAGANLPRLSPKQLAQFEIPLPSLSEQKRIADILDKADALRQKRKESIAKLDTLLQSVFLDMFGDPVTNPKGWKVKPLGELIAEIDSGWSPVCEARPALPQEWGVLKLGAVTTCRFLQNENKAILDTCTPDPSIEVHNGDVLFSRKNTYDLVAACALVRSTRQKLMLSDLIFRLVIGDPASLKPQYLWALLTNNAKRKQVQSLAGGAAGSMPNISKQKLRTVILPIPPAPLQERFSSIVIRTAMQQEAMNADVIALDTLFSLSPTARIQGGALMSNFLFLQQEWAELCQSAQRAESLAMSDPRASCFYGRRTLELAVGWLYKHDSSFGTVYDNSLGALIAHASFRANIPEAIYSKARFIQKIGNAAAHSPHSIKQWDALNTAKELFHFLYWFARTYTTGGAGKAIPAFDESLLQSAQGKSAATSREKLSELEARLKEQDAALAEKEAKIQSTDEEIAALKVQIEKIKAQNSKVPDPHDYSEAQTRDLFIDMLLKEAGWKLDKTEDVEFPVTGMPNKAGEGFVDYVLWGDDGLPLGVVEAKRTKKDPKIGRQQAKLYADCLEKQFGVRPIIFYTNGYTTHLWDDQNYPPREVQGFYTKNELQLLIQRRKTRKDPAAETINKEIAGRYYQEEAIRAIVEHLKEGHRRALVVMATGSGKTRSVIALCDLLMRCNMVKKVLFLADRTALVRQSVGQFKKHLPSANAINLLEDKEALNSRVVVSTYHTMMGMIDEFKGGESKRFGVGHFDLIIIDEAHRSVYQKFGALFQYFDGLLVGLTATPKSEVDRNTYELFQLEKGVPTYAYDMQKAVGDGFLVPPNAVSVPLKFQREGITYADLSDEEKARWDALEWDEEHGEAPDHVSSAALNKWLFNENTVEKVLAHLMTHGLKVKGGDRLGKTIIFAKNHRHATFISEVFDKNYPQHKGHFARVIDNYENYARKLQEEFEKPDNAPHIAISVDMLDTGVDIPAVVNLVFFKMLRSKTKFIQMIGRGTRLCPDLFGVGQDKTCFKIFDYCQNFEFFNENPAGDEAGAPESLSTQLFRRRLELIAGYRPLKSKDDDIEKLERGVATLLHGEVAAMNADNFIVRAKRKYIEDFKHFKRWADLTDSDIGTLARHVAGLPAELPEEEETAKRFDLLTIRLQLAVLEKSVILRRLRDQMIRIAGQLETKGAIPMVKAQLALILHMQDEAFWEGITLPMVENVRLKLRDLIQFIDRKEQKIVYTDFEDQIHEGEAVWLEDFSSGFNVTQYRKKVETFVRSHENNIVIHKIKTAVPLTKADLDQLDQFFFEAGEVESRDKFEKVFGKQDRLSVFIRRLVGLDKAAALESFGKYLDGKTCSADQIRFINFIVEHLTKNGVMEPSLLYEQPFTDIHANGLDGVFKDRQANDVISIIRVINDSAGLRVAGNG